MYIYEPVKLFFFSNSGHRLRKLSCFSSFAKELKHNIGMKNQIGSIDNSIMKSVDIIFIKHWNAITYKSFFLQRNVFMYTACKSLTYVARNRLYFKIYCFMPISRRLIVIFYNTYNHMRDPPPPHRRDIDGKLKNSSRYIPHNTLPVETSYGWRYGIGLTDGREEGGRGSIAVVSNRGTAATVGGNGTRSGVAKRIVCKVSRGSATP